MARHRDNIYEWDLEDSDYDHDSDNLQSGDEQPYVSTQITNSIVYNEFMLNLVLG